MILNEISQERNKINSDKIHLFQIPQKQKNIYFQFENNYKYTYAQLLSAEILIPSLIIFDIGLTVYAIIRKCILIIN